MPAGRQRVEVRGRLVEKEHHRIEGERAREGGALHHPARELRRELEAGVGGHAGQLELHRRDPLLCRRRKVGVLANRQHDVLRDGQRRKQRTLLEKYADLRRPLGGGGFRDRRSVQQHRSCIRPAQPDQRLQQHGFAGSRPPAMPRISPRITSRLTPSCTACRRSG
jgi:hypothetical protein